jgi:phage-related protein
MAAILGSLAVKVNSLGIAKAAKGMGKLQGRMGKFTKKMGPAFAKMSKTFKKFGSIATGAFFALAAASPLLRARMEVLNLRINELMRTFGDALAPIIEIVTGLVEGLTDVWESLPEPLQQAILFGVQVVAVLGLLAVAFVVLNAAMSPITLIILGIVAAAALLYLIWTENFGGIRDIAEAVFGKISELIESIMGLFGGLGGGVEEAGSIFDTVFKAIEAVVGAWFEMIGGYISGIIDQFQGIVNFIKAIFAGDLEGALEAIQMIFEGAFSALAEIVMWPLTAINELIKSLTGFDILGDIMNAGQEIIDAFIKGAQDALDAAAGIVTDILDGIGSLFGGSLPEKGPLKNMPQFGQDLGSAYMQGIVSGIEGAGGMTTFNRVFNIERVVLETPGITETEGRGFMDRMDTGVRRATF